MRGPHLLVIWPLLLVTPSLIVRGLVALLISNRCECLTWLASNREASDRAMDALGGSVDHDSAQLKPLPPGFRYPTSTTTVISGQHRNSWNLESRTNVLLFKNPCHEVFGIPSLSLL